jgi:hypothetical protein
MSPEDKHRLHEIRSYLDVRAKISDSDFESEVVARSASKLADIHKSISSKDGENFILDVAKNLNVAFEEIHSPEDVTNIRDKYLRQKELGLGQLELELRNPNVDALLFKRQQKPNHYIAILNLQETSSRAYWNRAHETSHRLIEPPQRELFHRHRANQKNSVERIVDLVAAEIAFYRPIFGPIVENYSNTVLSWDVVEKIRYSYASTSSLMAVTKAIIKQWPTPIFLIEAEFRGRKSNDLMDRALRTSVIDKNVHAKNTGIFFYPNMRPSLLSPIHRAFDCGMPQDDKEDLSKWITSTGCSVSSRNSFTSARLYGKNVLALVSPI